MPHGGHNILEPACFAKPILFGLHMENFREITSLFLQNNAAKQISAQNLKNMVLEFLSNETLRNELGKNAHDLVCKNKGAIDKSMELIDKALVSLYNV